MIINTLLLSVLLIIINKMLLIKNRDALHTVDYGLVGI